MHRIEFSFFNFIPSLQTRILLPEWFASKIWFIWKINLLAARNERESVQVAMRPKVSWSGSDVAGVVQVQCSDLCSTSGDRLVSWRHILLVIAIPLHNLLMLAGQIGCWTISNVAACCAHIGCPRCSCAPWSSSQSIKPTSRVLTTLMILWRFLFCLLIIF